MISDRCNLTAKRHFKILRVCPQDDRKRFAFFEKLYYRGLFLICLLFLGYLSGVGLSFSISMILRSPALLRIKSCLAISFPPSSLIAFCASASSESASLPFIAVNRPPILTYGISYSHSVFIDATARDTAISKLSRNSVREPSSARLWINSTFSKSNA